MRSRYRRAGMIGAAVLHALAPATLWSQGFTTDGTRSAMIGIAALVFAIAAATVAVILYRRQSERREPDVPPLVFPAAPTNQVRRAPSARFGAPAPGAAPGRAAFAPPAPSASSTATVSAPPVPIATAASAAQPTDSLVDGKTIRFHRPVDGTLQILPGRLEVVEGADTGQCIRFVRSGSESEITFGRSEGPPYRHIQLRAPTVSRHHARMRLDTDGWAIVNLSQTNPVVVNDQELAVDGTARTLRDGDRIEMGEVTFRFRER
jgi:hypothetical protein